MKISSHALTPAPSPPCHHRCSGAHLRRLPRRYQRAPPLVTVSLRLDCFLLTPACVGKRTRQLAEKRKNLSPSPTQPRARSLDPSVLSFSLSLHRHLYLCIASIIKLLRWWFVRAKQSHLRVCYAPRCCAGDS
jgi:hypothetical protein